MPKQRAQRKTLTDSQMYGRGMQEGAGILQKIKKWLKKTKVISRISSIAAPLLSVIPVPGARGAAIGLALAGQLAKQKGFGRIKSITCRQVEALKMGLGCPLTGGGISLAAAKRIFPSIKNITVAQIRALAALRGRHMKGGGISLAGGRATGLRGMGIIGGGVKLAGQGAVLAGGRGIRGGQKKKRRARRSIFIPL